MAMHAAARVGASVVGGALMVAGGQLIQRPGPPVVPVAPPPGAKALPAPIPAPVGQVAPPIPSGTAGVIVAITGLLMASVPLMDRLVDLKRLRKALDRAHGKIELQAARIDELEHGQRANRSLVAGVEAKTDEAIKTLVEKGFIEPGRPGADRPTPTLLVVEDDRATVQALNALFTHDGWSVHSATSVGEALLEVEKGYHYVLLDMKLVEPGDGLVVLRHIYEARVASRVVVCTAAPDSGPVYAECRRLAPDAIYVKRGRYDALLGLLKEHPGRPDAAELDRRANLVVGSGEIPVPKDGPAIGGGGTP